jgi:hypothetical protein
MILCNIFAEKIGFLTQNTTKLCKNCFFKKIANFCRRKSAKIAEISDHNIDPGSAFSALDLGDEDDDSSGPFSARAAHPLHQPDRRLGDVVTHDLKSGETFVSLSIFH